MTTEGENMDKSDQSQSQDDSQPPFSWRRTVPLLAVAWAIGAVPIYLKEPGAPLWVPLVIGGIVGVIVVGMTVRIF